MSTKEVYSVQIVQPGTRMETHPGSGELVEVQVGQILTGDRRLLATCLHGLRNQPPVAVPFDEFTTQKLAEYQAKRAPEKARHLRNYQIALDKLAAAGSIQLDASGRAVRDAAGEIRGKLTTADRHIVETAEAYGLTAVLPTSTKPATVQPAKTPAAE